MARARLPSITIPDVKDVSMCKMAVESLYEMIEQFHGEKEARGMFARYGRPLTPADIRERKKVQLAIAYHFMSKPNRQKLAEELAKQNEALPREKRFGPRGSTSVVAMRRQIDRVLDQKGYCDPSIAAARWAEVL
jgi:hypothetical protein